MVKSGNADRVGRGCIKREEVKVQPGKRGSLDKVAKISWGESQGHKASVPII